MLTGDKIHTCFLIFERYFFFFIWWRQIILFPIIVLHFLSVFWMLQGILYPRVPKIFYFVASIVLKCQFPLSSHAEFSFFVFFSLIVLLHKSSPLASVPSHSTPDLRLSPQPVQNSFHVVSPTPVMIVSVLSSGILSTLPVQPNLWDLRYLTIVSSSIISTCSLFILIL